MVLERRFQLIRRIQSTVVYALVVTSLLSCGHPGRVSWREFENSVDAANAVLIGSQTDDIELVVSSETDAKKLLVPQRNDITLRFLENGLNKDSVKMLAACSNDKLVFERCSIDKRLLSLLAGIALPEVEFLDCIRVGSDELPVLNANIVALKSCDSDAVEQVLYAFSESVRHLYVEGIVGADRSILICDMKQLQFCSLEELILQRGSLANLGNELTHLRLTKVDLSDEDLEGGLSKPNLQILSLSGVDFGSAVVKKRVLQPSIQAVFFHGPDVGYELVKRMVVCEVSRIKESNY